MMNEDVKRQQEHFNSISEEYFKARQNLNCLAINELLWSYFFKDKKYLTNSQIVLEPMCGFSDGKEILEKYLCLVNFEYEGFDYSEKIIEYAKMKNPNLKIEVKNILDFDVEEKYHLVIIIGGLHHVYNYTEEVIYKIYKCLKKGGYFINFEPTNNNLFLELIREKVYKSNSIFDEETEGDYKLLDLNKFYKNAGFEIKDQIYPGLLSYILYYNPDAFPWLNIGGTKLVKLIFKMDKLFFRNFIGKKFSFATLSLLKK
jgi:SAM-dependent methyltransferase